MSPNFDTGYARIDRRDGHETQATSTAKAKEVALRPCGLCGCRCAVGRLEQHILPMESSRLADEGQHPPWQPTGCYDLPRNPIRSR
jgi:hypothetical protein